MVWTYVVMMMLFSVAGLLFVACCVAGGADKAADRIQARLRLKTKGR